MTTTTATVTDEPARVLSARTRAAYAGDWALFTDHCAVNGSRVLPADPQSVVDFLNSCPAAPATRRRRVAAIDHHHAGAGYPRPGESVVVRAALGRPTSGPFQPTERDAVEAALRGLPSHGSSIRPVAEGEQGGIDQEQSCPTSQQQQSGPAVSRSADRHGGQDRQGKQGKTVAAQGDKGERGDQRNQRQPRVHRRWPVPPADPYQDRGQD